MNARSEIRDARYVSLVTFKKSGAEVATPIWAAADGDTLYAFSAGNAGKIKRLRNSNAARLAKCDARGGLLGEYVDATAEIITETTEIASALKALRTKYGWQMWLADVGAKLTGRFDKRAYLRLALIEQGEA